MKKTKMIALLLCAQFAFVGCGGDDSSSDNSGNETTQTAVQAKADGFFLNLQNIPILIDANELETVEKLSGDPGGFEEVSCAYDGIDKIYSYNDYVITFYETADKDNLVQSIRLTSDLTSTNEGISIGDTKEDVINAYGENEDASENLIIYEKNGTNLKFVFENDIVVLIEVLKIF